MAEQFNERFGLSRSLEQLKRKVIVFICSTCSSTNHCLQFCNVHISVMKLCLYSFRSIIILTSTRRFATGTGINQSGGHRKDREFFNLNGVLGN